MDVDYCAACYGLWLDDGELNAIIGEKTEIDKIQDTGRLKKFLKSMGRLLGRQDA